MIFKICAYSILALVVILLGKELGWRGAPLVAVSVLLFAVGLVLPTLKSVNNYYSSLFLELNLADISKTAIKLIGLGYLVGIVVDICREMGEGLIAKGVLIVGRIEIISIVAPYFFEVIRIGVSLI